MRSTGLFLSLSVLLLNSCFHYVEVQGDLSQVPRGSEVRASFTEPETVQLGDITVQQIVGLDAEFVRADNSDVIFSAFWLESGIRQGGFPGDGWSVRISLDNISRFELKKVSFWRTAGAVAGVFLASYFGWEALGGGGSGENDDGGPGPIK